MTRLPDAWLPFTTPEEEGLDGCSRAPYEVTAVSRFREPLLMLDGSHDPACPCDACRCPKCDRRGGRTNCETCRILAASPYERGPYPKHYDNAPDHNPPKPEIWPTIRSNGQRIGDPVRVKPTCAKCGHAIRDNLRQVGEGFECTNTGSCEAQVRANAKLAKERP